jgi:metal-responsive CopG/Arc/MetJ family transcriptional regulator
MVDLTKLRRTATRSFMSDETLLKEADELLKKEGSNISSFCHDALVEYVRKKQSPAGGIKKIKDRDTLH